MHNTLPYSLIPHGLPTCAREGTLPTINCCTGGPPIVSMAFKEEPVNCAAAFPIQPSWPTQAPI